MGPKAWPWNLDSSQGLANPWNTAHTPFCGTKSLGLGISISPKALPSLGKRGLNIGAFLRSGETEIQTIVLLLIVIAIVVSLILLELATVIIDAIFGAKNNTSVVPIQCRKNFIINIMIVLIMMTPPA